MQMKPTFESIDGVATWIDRVACIHFKRGLVLHKLTMGSSGMDGLALNFQETLYAMMRCKMLLLLKVNDGITANVTLEDLFATASIEEVIKAHVYLHIMKLGKGPIKRLEPLPINNQTISRVLDEDVDAEKLETLPLESPVPPNKLLECFQALMVKCKVKVPRLLTFNVVEPIYKIENYPVWVSVPDGTCLEVLKSSAVTTPSPSQWLVAVSSLETTYVLEFQEFAP